MALTLLPTAAFAADSDFTIENGMLMSYNGPGGAVTIPDGVTSIGVSAFENCESVTSVVIPNSVTLIDRWAFADCTGMTSVTIGSGVTKIEGLAFFDCTGLTSVTIPDSVTSVGDRPFFGCTGLTGIQVSAGNQAFTSVDGVLFSKDLKNIVICPEGRKGAYTIPSSVTNIAYGAFSGCAGLTSVTIPNSVTRIEDSAFEECAGLTSVTIPSSVTSLESRIFENCTSLTSVSIPGSVAEMGNSAFGDCTALRNVYYGGSEAQWNAIVIGYLNDALTSATIHYNSAMPTQPTTPTQPANLAYASTQNVLLDGKPVEFQAYALKDASGNDTNYVKLRDVAYALNGTAAQFDLGWDQASKSIAVTSGAAYEANGSEMKTPYSGNRAYTVSTSPVVLDGSQVSLEAILLTDDAGSGYTYFKLRDLGQQLGFNVTWNGSSIVVESDKPYTG